MLPEKPSLINCHDAEGFLPKDPRGIGPLILSDSNGHCNPRRCVVRERGKAIVFFLSERGRGVRSTRGELLLRDRVCITPAMLNDRENLRKGNFVNFFNPALRTLPSLGFLVSFSASRQKFRNRQPHYASTEYLKRESA